MIKYHIMTTPYGEGVQHPGSIQLLPNDSTRWGLHDIPSLDSFLLIAPGCSKDTAHKLLTINQTEVRSSLTHLGTGSFATVAGDQKVAYKFFDFPFGDSDSFNLASSGLGSLAANAALQKGLALQRPLGYFKNKIVLNAPELYGALLPRRTPGVDTQVAPAWAMEQIHASKVTSYEDLPSHAQNDTLLRDRFSKAVARFGIEPVDINFDLHKDNMLFRGNTLTKLDIMMHPSKERLLSTFILETFQ